MRVRRKRKRRRRRRGVGEGEDLRLSLNIAVTAAVCAVWVSAGRVGGHQCSRCWRCGYCLLGGFRGEEDKKKDKDKEGATDPRPIVTTPSMFDNCHVATASGRTRNVLARKVERAGKLQDRMRAQIKKAC